MKKILLVLLVMITSLIYSNNLDKYESKRVFEKFINILKTGDYKKYRKDNEMKYVLELFNDENMNSSIMKQFQLSIKDNKYKIIAVKEENEKSLLTIEIEHNVYDLTKEEFLNIATKITPEYSKIEGDDLSGMMFVFMLSNELFKTHKNKLRKENARVDAYLQKDDSSWCIEDIDDFYETILDFIPEDLKKIYIKQD